jgi:hypothetical protein
VEAEESYLIVFKRLKYLIASATEIELEYVKDPTEACVVAKLSGASRRRTSRVEDMAYCLMGIFDVNMVLLYCEGRRACLRLQLEIIKFSGDESIFAWTSSTKSSGMLAAWPPFGGGNSQSFIPPFRKVPKSEKTAPYSMTNKSLRYQLLM